MEGELSSLHWLPEFCLRTELPSLWEAEALAVTKATTTTTEGEGRRRKCQCTFSCLIFRALEESGQKALPLQGIYEAILRREPGLGLGGRQWQRSLRHSLSLNAAFVRFAGLKGRDFGSRGCWWTVHPDYRRLYAAQVLRSGPQHRCLPRTGPRSKAPIPVPCASSQAELAALEADLRAAAAICGLSGSLSPDSSTSSAASTAALTPHPSRKRRRKDPSPKKRSAGPRLTTAASSGPSSEEHSNTSDAPGTPTTASGPSSPRSPALDVTG